MLIAQSLLNPSLQRLVITPDRSSRLHRCPLHTELFLSSFPIHLRYSFFSFFFHLHNFFMVSASNTLKYL